MKKLIAKIIETYAKYKTTASTFFYFHEDKEPKSLIK